MIARRGDCWSAATGIRSQRADVVGGSCSCSRIIISHLHGRVLPGRPPSQLEVAPKSRRPQGIVVVAVVGQHNLSSRRKSGPLPSVARQKCQLLAHSIDSIFPQNAEGRTVPRTAPCRMGGHLSSWRREGRRVMSRRAELKSRPVGGAQCAICVQDGKRQRCSFCSPLVAAKINVNLYYHSAPTSCGHRRAQSPSPSPTPP